MLPIERGREANAPPQQKEIGMARYNSSPFPSLKKALQSLPTNEQISKTP